jgi:hypothetical protein
MSLPDLTKLANFEDTDSEEIKLRGRNVHKLKYVPKKRKTRIASTDHLLQIIETSPDATASIVNEHLHTMTDRNIGVRIASAEAASKSGGKQNTVSSDKINNMSHSEDEMQGLRDQVAKLHNALHEAEDKNDALKRKHAAAIASNSKKISDSIVAPKPFLGKPEEQDPVDWIVWFEKYCAYKQLDEKDKRELFVMMLQGSAGDWLSSTAHGYETPPAFEKLKDDFLDCYAKPKELNWQTAASLFHEIQGPSERTLDYLARMRKLARRLEFPDEILHMAVVQGLRPALKRQVIQNGLVDLETTIRNAKLAESVESTSADNMSSALVELMKATLENSKQQTSEIKSLSGKVAAMTTNASVTHEKTGQKYNDRTQQHGQQQNYGQRFLKATPRNRQRINYNRMAAEEGAARAQHGQNTNAIACQYCGRHHAAGIANCPAAGQQCYNCLKLNHLSRVCRSARRTQQQQH